MCIIKSFDPTTKKIHKESKLMGKKKQMMGIDGKMMMILV
jgi:cell fate regulator YaaT (PSP1 superfamily)